VAKARRIESEAAHGCEWRWRLAAALASAAAKCYQRVGGGKLAKKWRRRRRKLAAAGDRRIAEGVKRNVASGVGGMAKINRRMQRWRQPAKLKARPAAAKKSASKWQYYQKICAQYEEKRRNGAWHGGSYQLAACS